MVSSSFPGSQSAQASCLATLQQFPGAFGFCSAVAEQSSLARRPSSLAVYQVRWSIYRGWYHNNGHSVSRPTLAKVADFLYWLWLQFSVICGVPFSPSILVFGSGDSGSVTLLPTLFGGACAASPCLGLVYGIDIFFQEYEETCLFTIARFSASESLRVYPNI